MTTQSLRWTPPRRRRGFTAIELTAVASIIAILALILVPILRGRLANARVVATNDDMRSIEIAMMLANAENQLFFRLSDLDNPQNEVPLALWNQPLDPVTNSNVFAAMSATWNGPYMTYNDGRFVTLAQLDASFPLMRRVEGGAGSGPILLLNQSGLTDPLTSLLRDELGQRHPVDQWQSPFLFFAPEPFGANAGSIAVTTESFFAVAAVYSLGPDRLPGDLQNPQAQHFFRESGVLGNPNSDDLIRIF